jgi:transcriptional regulator with XRE-family HTH domain
LSPSGMGPRIKELRKKRGWTQPQLAERIGVTAVHVANLESPDDAAHHRAPSLATLEKIAKALKVRLSDLVETPRRQRSKKR